MARNLSTLIEGVTVAPGASAYYDIFIQDIFHMKVLTEITYQQTSTTTGCSGKVFQGFGPSDPATDDTPLPLAVAVNTSPTTVPVFADNYERLCLRSTPLGSNTPVVTKTSFYLNEVQNIHSRWIRIVLTNNDTAFNAVITLHVDHS